MKPSVTRLHPGQQGNATTEFIIIASAMGLLVYGMMNIQNCEMESCGTVATLISDSLSFAYDKASFMLRVP